MNTEAQLFGEREDDENKKVERITVSLSSEDWEIVNMIANEKNIPHSKVINLLIQPTIRTIRKQEELIAQSPRLVAFDLVTAK